MGKLLYEKESYEIRGACFWVWKEFGSSFKESIIQRALISELRKRGLTIEKEKRIDIFYNGEKVGTYVPDIIAEKKIVIELKVKPFLTKEDEFQFWRYLKNSHYRLGFLINFGHRLQIKRRVFDKARESPRNPIRVRSASKEEDPLDSASTPNT